jgi:hypothetical protein
MTISIKRRSGGEILAAAREQQFNMAEVYRARYAAVPVTKKHPRSTLSVRLKAALWRSIDQTYACNFVSRQAQLRKQYGE